MKINHISAPWLNGTVPEIQLNMREAGQVCRAMQVNYPKPGWSVGLGPTWFGPATLTNHGAGLLTLDLHWEYR